MAPDDIKRIRQRLTPEWIVNHTGVFQADPGWPDPVTAKIIADRFAEYWNTWIKEDLETIFNEIDNA